MHPLYSAPYYRIFPPWYHICCIAMMERCSQIQVQQRSSHAALALPGKGPQHPPVKLRTSFFKWRSYHADLADIIRLTMKQSALQCSYYEGVGEEDKFFIPKEYKSVLWSKGAVKNNVATSIAEAGSPCTWRIYLRLNMPMPCSQRIQINKWLSYSTCLGRLISLLAVLTDHNGSELLLPFLFQKQNRLKCGLGSP